MKRFLKMGVWAALLIGAFLLTACGSQKAITGDDFLDKMEAKGYEVFDISDQYSADIIYQALIAQKDDYQIEFYDLMSTDDAISAFDYNKSDFESLQGAYTKNTNVEFKNGARYTLTIDGSYKLISRIDNTFIYLDIPEEYKNEVVKVLKELGY